MASRASANGISAVMGLGVIHLMFGNAVIGVIEGLLIGWIFKVGKPRAVGLMVVANYASTLATFLLLPHSAIDLNNAMFWAYATPPLCFVFTLALEWPFCLLILRRAERGVRKSVWAVLLVNAVSYLLIFPLYYDASDHSLYRLAKLDPGLAKTCALPAYVYFIEPEEKALYRVGINGQGLAKVMDAPPAEDYFDYHSGIFVRTSASGDGHKELWLQGHHRDEPEAVRTKLLDFSPEFTASDGIRRDLSSQKEEIFYFYDGGASLAPAEKASRWTVRTRIHSWALAINDEETQRIIRLKFETPFIMLHPSFPTLLPEDWVVYKLGDFIVLLDLKTMRFCQLAKGCNPVVVLGRKAAQ